MDHLNYPTEHRKGQHLLSEERPEFVALRTEFGHWELEVSELKIYFTHPYTSCEKGTNE